MDIEVIDNFLPEESFLYLKQMIIDNPRFPWFLSTGVSTNEDDPESVRISDTVRNELWNTFHYHLVYNQNLQCTPINGLCDDIMQIFGDRLNSVREIKSLIRIKVNSYSYTPKVMEHGPHIDIDIPCVAALYSLNTCNGYTKFKDGTKVDSVGNRIVFFDASEYHQSTTTSDQKFRFNINFNYL